MTDLTYAELFAGAGGLSMGLELAGWRCVAHAEIEPHARAVLRKHWPDTRLDGDVTAINGADYAGVTLLSGGSPCQDLSIAGKRKGLGGARSGLFHEQVRIWRESGAPLFLWENVLGALSSNNGGDFGVVLSTIVGGAVPVPTDGWGSAGVASGPAGVAAWRVLDAQYFGVPQRRRRVFVLGARAGGVDPAEVLLDGDGVCGDSAAGGEAGQGVAADAGRGVAGGGAIPILEATARQGKSAEGSAGIGNPGGQEVGNQTRGVVIQPAVCVTGDITHALTHEGADASEDGTGRGTPIVARPDALAYDDRNQASAKVHHTLRAEGIGGRVSDAVLTYDARGNGEGDVVNTLAGDHANRVTDYTPIVMRQREGKPGGGNGPLLSEGKSLTLGTSNDQVVFPAARMVAFGEYVEDGTASAIKARDHKDATDLVYATGRPRRLMPVECERLMGWPDNHTAIGVDEQGREYALKDTPRYKLCGNGVLSACVAWIGFRLRDALDTRPERA